MNEEQIVKKIKELEKERKELVAKRRPIEERLMESYKELETLYEKRDKIRLKKMTKNIDPEFVLIPEHESRIMFREAERQVRELGLHSMGYFPETGQADIRLMLDDNNLEKTYESVMLLLPYMKVWEKTVFKGKKVFGIFEHTLSINGSYFFVVSDKGCQVIHMRSHSRGDVKASFETIKEGLEYVQKYHYYKREGGEENE